MKKHIGLAVIAFAFALLGAADPNGVPQAETLATKRHVAGVITSPVVSRSYR